jgi:hypothetical protein
MESIDFGAFKIKSKPRGRPIVKCPKCGRKGEQSTYRNGSKLIIHSGELGEFALHVRDSCFIPAEQPK